MKKCNIKLLIQKVKNVRLTEHSLLIAVLLNIIYLGGMLLIYQSFLSPDDYLMSETVYGVFGDDYDYHAKYMNFNYGRIIVQLLRWFPSIPWYTILFYVWVFLALTLISKIVLDKFPKTIAYLMVNTVLLYFSYEGYICIQFTKIAGITGAAGATAILLCSSWVEIILGILLFILSLFIRYDMAKMVIGAFLAMLLCTAVIEFVSKRKVKWDKRIYVRFAIVAVVFFVVPLIPSYDQSEKVYWDYFWQCNGNRSYIQDYSLPDYETYRDIYEKLGISQNDIYIWKSWNTDGQAMTKERVDVLRKVNEGKIKNKEQIETYEFHDKDIQEDFEQYVTDRKNNNKRYKKSASLGMNQHVFASLGKSVRLYLDFENITEFFKKFPKAFLTIDVAFAYLLCVILILVTLHRKNLFSFIAVMLSFFIGLLLNYYMYVHERYLQHRVDVGVFLTLICMCIILYQYEVREKTELEKKYAIRIGMLLIAVGLITPYKYYGDDYNPYSDDQLLQNQNLMQYMEKNENCCYQLVGTMNKGVTWNKFYDAFTVPKKCCESNIFYSYSIGNLQQYQEHGISYVYSDIVDNDSIYLVLNDNDTNEVAWEEYISKHSGKEVELEFQENIYGAKFYLVKSADLLHKEME